MFKNIYLLSLQTFSSTGGIQKMTRVLAHSLFTLSRKNGWNFKLASLYDSNDDLMPQYVPSASFEGYRHQRLYFLWKTILSPAKNDVIILSHINLALAGLFIKLIHPRTQIWLIAHGIEVWRPLPYHKRRLLNKCDKVLCVSHFTRSQLFKWHRTSPDKCVVLNNVLDPFMNLPREFSKPAHLLNRYGLNQNHKIIFSLTRLASTELYKGYDRVIKAIANLKANHPNIKYVLAGAYDEAEGRRVKQLINESKLDDAVILTGYIPEQELAEHFLMADNFVLPSKKEGFGIVFIEALACGLPVICGNVDGSLDAIRNGELGKAINPDAEHELENAIAACLANPLTIDDKKLLQQKCLQYFSELNYVETLQTMIKHA